MEDQWEEEREMEEEWEEEEEQEEDKCCFPGFADARDDLTWLETGSSQK